MESHEREHLQRSRPSKGGDLEEPPGDNVVCFLQRMLVLAREREQARKKWCVAESELQHWGSESRDRFDIFRRLLPNCVLSFQMFKVGKREELEAEKQYQKIF